MRNIFVTEIIIELGYNHAIMHLTDFGEEVETSATQKEKSKDICMAGYPEKYHFLLFLKSILKAFLFRKAYSLLE